MMIGRGRRKGGLGEKELDSQNDRRLKYWELGWELNCAYLPDDLLWIGRIWGKGKSWARVVSGGAVLVDYDDDGDETHDDTHTNDYDFNTNRYDDNMN